MGERPRILFLADAGAKVGGGHVMRCLTLAGALTRAGGTCAFVAAPAARGVLDAFSGRAVEVMAVGDEPSASELAAAGVGAAEAWSADAIVADHYGFGPRDDAALDAAAARLLIVDDLRRRHACGLVLDSNIGRRAADYPGREVLAGPAYALVRPAFAALRTATLARRASGEAPKRVLVSLGLTDAGAITGRVVRALLPALGEASLDVVVGGEAPSRLELQALARVDSRVTVHVDARDMAGLIAAADIAVGAGGSSAWERCCLGLPSLTVIVADNQRENTAALAGAGATLAVAPPSGDFDARLRAAFGKLRADAALRASMSAAAAALCDGLGADRVAERLLAPAP
ncbi:MAG TPA: UDP-2,4-diacetamido-2,4,6-trideoxy-beta-L-altropyranose hydrolase [Caulobacteraceae bacterium]|jgi:UDP-2,4-diacetamido-2,4,6-trideoxy-beta-L-altropyranose hydrolase|nr:UDP-2,4-diacetamido-2,4,6-trideoxy-beta-L-altropyranose hydrolase [Caulobacteraceae bacterium]